MSAEEKFQSEQLSQYMSVFTRSSSLWTDLTHCLRFHVFYEIPFFCSLGFYEFGEISSEKTDFLFSSLDAIKVSGPCCTYDQ